MNIDEVIENYPNLTKEDVNAAQAYAADYLAGEKIEAMEELQLQASERGANAVIGVDIDYETAGGQGSMLMVSISGTAVVVR